MAQAVCPLRAHCSQGVRTLRARRRVVACRASYHGRVVGRVTPLRHCVMAHGRRVAGPLVGIQNCIVV